MMIPWNLTRHAAASRSADVIVVSPAKAGRTWLRVMINKYLSLKYKVPFSIDDLYRHDTSIPSIHYSHWIWAHLRLAEFHERLRGRYLIPAHVLSRKKVILLVRDPRDIIVSSYFQLSKRRSENRVEQPLREFIRERKLGMETIVRGFNIAYRKLHRHPDHLIVKYEEMKTDPARELGKVLKFIGEPIDTALLADAVAFGDFNNMKRMEQNDEFGHVKLRPGDPRDPDSYKVRKGQVGGYVEHFGEDDIAYANTQLSRLHPDFGYSTGRRGAV